MHIRQWQDGDDLRLLEIFGDPATAQHHHDRTMLGPSTQDPYGVGLVAVDDGIPVAAGAIRQQTLHPQRLWCFVETAPLQRQRGIGSQIFEQLTQQAPHDSAFKTRSVAQDEDTNRWLTNRGFAPIQYAQRVITAAQTFGTTDLTVQQLATGSVELSTLVAKYYNATHNWDPTDLSITQAQHLFLAPSTGAQQALVAREAEQIVAFAIAYPGPVQDVVELFVGHDPKHPDVTKYVQAVLATAGQHRSLAIETDRSTTVLNHLLENTAAADTILIEHQSIIWATDAPQHA